MTHWETHWWVELGKMQALYNIILRFKFHLHVSVLRWWLSTSVAVSAVGEKLAFFHCHLTGKVQSVDCTGLDSPNLSLEFHENLYIRTHLNWHVLSICFPVYQSIIMCFDEHCINVDFTVRCTATKDDPLDPNYIQVFNWAARPESHIASTHSLPCPCFVKMV